jgi:hypothetical protein
MDKTPNITLPLDVFIANHLGNGKHWCCPINKEIAKVLCHLDRQEQFCHIEFYEPSRAIDLIENSEIIFECRPTKDHPAILWDIKFWRESVTYQQRRKHRSATENEVYQRKKKLIATLALAIQEITQMSMVDYCIPRATKIVSTNDRNQAKFYGIELP